MGLFSKTLKSILDSQDKRAPLRSFALASLSLIPYALTSNIEYEYTLVQLWIALVVIPFLGSLKARDSLSYFFPSVTLSLIWGCNTLGYLFWVAFLIVPSLLWGALLLRYCRTKIGYFAVLLLGVGVCLVAVWAMPQVRIYTFIFGFIHGPIYDHRLYVSGSLLSFCSLHLALGVVLVYWGNRSRFILAQVVLIAVMPFVDQASLGMASLKKHFPIVYEKGQLKIYAQKDNPTVHRMTKEADFHYRELVELLDMDVPVSVFIYSSMREKKILFGGGESDVTDVFNRTIHVTQEEFMHSTLRHELVHALFSSQNFLGFHLNMAITEGVAVAFAPEARQIDLHVAAGGILEQSKIKNIDRLFSPLFWLEGGSRAYTVAGSFVRYVLDNHGVEETKRIFRNLWFDEHQFVLFQNWQSWVKEIYRQSQSSQAVDHVFQMGGILERRCPHTLADIRIQSFWCPGWISSDSFAQDPLSVYRSVPLESLSLEQIVGDELRTRVFREDMRALKEGVVHKDLLEEFWPESLKRHIRVRDELLTLENPKEWLSYLSGRNKIPDLELKLTDPFVLSYLKMRNRPKAIPNALFDQLFQNTPCLFYCNIWTQDLLRYAFAHGFERSVPDLLHRLSPNLISEYEQLVARLALDISREEK